MAEVADQKQKPLPFPWAAAFWAMFGPIIGMVAAGLSYDLAMHGMRILVAIGVGMGFLSIWLMATAQCLRWYWR